MNRLAVVIPIYKNDSYINTELAILSIKGQLSNSDLIIIQVDGPIDNELKGLINQYKDFENVKINFYSVNRGLAAVLNDGINFAINEGFNFIARMDADDISLNDRLTKQLHYLENNPNVDLLGTQSLLINHKGIIIGIKKVPLFLSFASLLKSCDIVHPSVMFRSTFFSKFGFYDEKMIKSQDYELWLRASKKGAVIHNLPDFLFKLRYEDSIVSRRKNEQKYNIKLKKIYSKSYLHFLIISWKHFIILILPSWFLRFILKFKTLI